MKGVWRGFGPTHPTLRSLPWLSFSFFLSVCEKHCHLQTTRWCPVRAWLFFTFLPNLTHLSQMKPTSFALATSRILLAAVHTGGVGPP